MEEELPQRRALCSAPRLRVAQYLYASMRAPRARARLLQGAAPPRALTARAAQTRINTAARAFSSSRISRLRRWNAALYRLLRARYLLPCAPVASISMARAASPLRASCLRALPCRRAAAARA